MGELFVKEYCFFFQEQQIEPTIVRVDLGVVLWTERFQGRRADGKYDDRGRNQRAIVEGPSERYQLSSQRNCFLSWACDFGGLRKIRQVRSRC